MDYSTSPITLGALVLNSIDASGVRWRVTRFDGWGGASSSLLDTQRGRGDGDTESEAFLTARVMSIQGQCFAPDAATFSAAMDSLILNASIAPFTMQVSESGRVRWVTARRKGELIVSRYNQFSGTFTIQLVAKDPLKYGDLITATTALPSSSGGLTYPITYPITYTGVSNSGVIHIDNPGNEPAPVYLRIDGSIPAGGWSVNHLGQARDLAFASSLALGAGEFVTVDMQKREVLAQGQATRNGYVTSRGWFQLDPGPNDIAFSAVAYDPTALLTLTTYPAWS